MIQRRTARSVMARYGQWDSVTEMLEELSWDTWKQSKLKVGIIMGYRITHKLVMIQSEQLKPSKDTSRGHDMKYIQLAQTKIITIFLLSWNDSPMELPSSDNSVSHKHRRLQRQTICCPHQISLLAASYTNILTCFYLGYLPTLYLFLYSFPSSLLTFSHFTNTWPCAIDNGLTWPPLQPKKSISYH